MASLTVATNNLPIPAKLVSYISGNQEITEYFKQLADKIEEMNNNIIMLSEQNQELNDRITTYGVP